MALRGVLRWGALTVLAGALGTTTGAAPARALGIQPWIESEVLVFDTSPPPLPRAVADDLQAGTLTSGGTPTTLTATAASVRGNARAETTGGLLPSLKMRAATATPDPGGSQPGLNSASGTGWLLGAYEHTGTMSRTYNLTLDLTGMVMPDTTSSPLGQASLTAFAFVYRTDAIIEGQSIPGDDPELFLAFLAPNEIANGTLDLAPGQTSVSTPISFTVSSREKFYLYAGATAQAINGVSVADGSNTFQLVFDDTSNLQLVVDEVPEPGTVHLLAAGGMGLLAFARRQRAPRR